MQNRKAKLWEHTYDFRLDETHPYSGKKFYPINLLLPEAL
jgi:hypothetical protein